MRVAVIESTDIGIPANLTVIRVTLVVLQCTNEYIDGSVGTPDS